MTDERKSNNDRPKITFSSYKARTVFTPDPSLPPLDPEVAAEIGRKIQDSLMSHMFSTDMLYTDVMDGGKIVVTKPPTPLLPSPKDDEGEATE